ncbi:MAG: aromatic ring-hydroxylating dioxygenase subunit alpha [Chthonomonadaceae bacterium]|nr:aromatic ring-hydroxylating dioxygenase subunit alpha [Chthonomonadaceae bacterium]
MSAMFDMDPTVERAQTIPSRFYTDPAVFESSKESVFAKSWQIAGTLDDIKVPGQVFPFQFLDGFVDEPLVLTRDREDKVHCLSNVCTHRGNVVVEGCGNMNSLRCRYHGRKFGLDGGFQFMPEFENVEGFPCEADNLPKVDFGFWKQFYFTSLAPSVSLEAYLHDMDARVGWMPIEHFRLAPERARDYLVKGHWALYVDNYLEGFHIPYIHSALNATLDYGAYRTILLNHGNLQLGVAASGEEAFDLPVGHPDSNDRVGAFYFWLYPNLMFNFYPWGLSVNIVRPIEPGLTKVSFIPYVWNESKLGSGAGAALDRVEREDEAVVEMVQKGLHSRFYDRGKFSPKRESGVHQFHCMLARSLG